MKKLLSGLLVFLFALTLWSSRVSASELLCALSTATSTSCAPLSANPFVAFAPSANRAAGNYNAAQEVVLSAEQSTSIRYTIDVSAPSCVSGTLYTAPLSVKKSQTVRAIACYPGGVSSAVSTHAYLLSVFDARSENATLTTSGGGTAALPTNATSVTLSNTTKLDLSSAVATSSAGQITVGGTLKTLSAFTSGNLVSVDLSAPISVGGQSVSVDKAVAIQSGVNGEPVLLSNKDFSRANVSIPDGAAVLAPAGWNGTIAPPRATTRTGTAPTGFSVGTIVVEVGSDTETLLFDTPVSVVLSEVTGAVGYKASGATSWIQIGNQCGGTYDTPSAPVFPGECYISNGTDTKIHTYHFTSFASLNSVSSESAATPKGGNGPVGFGSTRTAGDMNGDGAVDIFDFNILFAAWGVGSTSGPFYASADLNRDNRVDILDFNMLMLNWK